MPPDLAAAVRLGGEMGRRFAEFDWHEHPLGPPSGWPVEVRSMVAVALTSRFPIVLWLGRQDLYLVYNDAYIPMLSDKHPAALGRPGRQVWWDIWEYIAPMLSGVVTSGHATWSDDLMLALVTEGWAQERYFTFSYSPIILGSGQVDGVFCAVTETTERVLGERRLHLLNAVAGAVMETRTVDEAVEVMVHACGHDHPDLPFIAVYLDGDDERPSLRAASPRVEGLVPQDISTLDAAGSDAHRGTYRIVELEDAAPAIAAAFKESGPTRALLMPIGEAGAEQTSGRLMVGLNPRRRVDGQYRGFLRLLADQMSAALAAADSYRQQQRRADTLAELDRAKTAFLTNVSHEFRTPLTLLLGPLEDAIGAAGADAAQWERLTMARRNGQRLLRLVNSLLEFSRIEAGRAVLAPRPVDVGALTAQVASSFAGLCERAGIALVLECEPVTADVDVELWETVVLNLLSNAVKFTYHGSITVRVEATPSGGARLRVSDTGTGIAAADLERLFERFYRASNARGRSVEGTGIGLSLVRSLVELHGGTVGAESVLDRGTTVTIELPESHHATTASASELPPRADNAYVAEAEQWLDKPVAMGAARDTNRKLVLIADDNADMRAHLHRILSQRWDTVVVADGRAALDAVRVHRPDLVVTDVMMPLLDGFGFVQALRHDPKLAATPVLMLSARAGAEAAGDGFAAGADDYLTKPFTSTELLQRAEARLRADARQQAQRVRQEAKVRGEAAAADLAAAITASESIEAILDALLSGPLTATAVAIGVHDPDGGHLTMHYAGDVPPEMRARYHRIALDAPVPVARVATTGKAMIISDTTDLDPSYEQYVRDAGLQIRASVTHPLRDASGIIIGVVALIWPQPHTFDEATLDLSAQAAIVTGQALARITTATWEHHIATGFQDHLLDLDRGSTDAVIAAVYQPAAETMRVGGDWYLATPLGPGSIGVCVGDVVGHGLPSATVMGKLRAAVAATALSSPEPGHVLSTVQRYAATVSGARCASLAYATIDTTRGSIDYVCAGHPYPVLVTPDGRVRLLDKGRMPPLAAFSLVRSRAPGHESYPPGSLLILYTDGLVERRGQSLDEGFARLVAAAADCATLPVDTVCATLLKRLAPNGGYTDDVVILALRPVAVTDSSFVACVPAAPTELAPLRHRLGEWLGQMGLDTNTFHDVLIATGEAAVNAIEHGSGMDSSKTISLEAFAAGGIVTVSVTDTGQWRGDSSASRRSRQRGRGLTLMHGMADQVDTVRSPQGTAVTLYFRRSPAKIPAKTGA